MSPRRRLLAALGALAAAGLAAGVAAYLADMREIRARLAAEAARAPTRSGPIAFAAAEGAGKPVLVVHGAGGGLDQGRLVAEAFLPAGTAWIAPSRFGYPGSPLPKDASTAAQADAFADLLDHLGIGRVALLAMSGGVPPALHFAARHPERTAGLVLLSAAPYAPLDAGEQALPVPLWLYDALFASDLPYWLVARTSPAALAPIFDARSDLTAAMPPGERPFLAAMIRLFLPVTDRAGGLRNEGAAIDPGAANPLPAIAAPALIVHARDDRIAPFATAAFTAAGLGDAELVAFDRGGHLLLGHHAEIRARVGTFLSDRAATTATR